MDTNHLINQFERIGARLKVVDRPTRWQTRTSGSLSLDIAEDRFGEFFELVPRIATGPNLLVLDTQPKDRHLVLMVRESDGKSKFLCGHDERHWFVAGIPESASVGTVRQAKEALKPLAVRDVQSQMGLRANARNRRKNAAYVRQGEWFFLPAPDLVVDRKLVLRDEPLVRGHGGKPHRMEFCYRTGGELVYTAPQHRNVLTEPNYRRLISQKPETRRWGWRTMYRNPEVYVRGRVRHADHATITLHDWHRVLMNTENESRAMRNVAFLD